MASFVSIDTESGTVLTNHEYDDQPQFLCVV